MNPSYKYVNSKLNVSLTYLKGLEVAELKEEDMPMVSALYIHCIIFNIVQCCQIVAKN